MEDDGLWEGWAFFGLWLAGCILLVSLLLMNPRRPTLHERVTVLEKMQEVKCEKESTRK